MADSLLMDDSTLFDKKEQQTIKLLVQPVVTREEVYLTGKENIEGLMCVLNHFLPQMTSPEVDDAVFINLSNENLD